LPPWIVMVTVEVLVSPAVSVMVYVNVSVNVCDDTRNACTAAFELLDVVLVRTVAVDRDRAITSSDAAAH